jgi:hypothetical protein
MSEAECAIPMCGGEGELTLFCNNGHRMHSECIEALVKSTYPTPPPCPLCRDQSVGAVSMSVMPDLLYMALTPFSQTAAVVAMMIGEREYQTMCANGGDPRSRR